MKTLKQKLKRLPFPWVLILEGGLLALCFLLSLLCGAAALSPLEVIEGLFGGGDETTRAIVLGLRLPRALAGLLAGAALSVSGVLLQSVTGNGLASTNVIGVNSGAGLAVILLLAFFPALQAFLPFFAFLGAFAATLVTVYLARRFGGSASTVVLAGVALTSLFNAAISFITLLDTDVVSAYNYFSIGGLSGVLMQQLPLPALFILVSFLLSLLLSRPLEALRLGDGTAKSLGVRVTPLRTVALICACASAAASVSFAGLLGFVGLVVPHMTRALVGERISRILPASALLGGSLVLLSDLVGRTLLAPTEIPVGILMALIGAPFFLFLLIRRCRHA